MRTIVDLPDEQIAGLGRLCASAHISRAEAIRRAVKEFLDSQDRLDHERAIDAAFGAWRCIGVSTDDYLAEIRKEWDHGHSTLGDY